jgi:hypothetical protein
MEWVGFYDENLFRLTPSSNRSGGDMFSHHHFSADVPALSRQFSDLTAPF